MKNFSLTQGGILVAVIGTILTQWGFSKECTNEMMTNIPLLIGGVMAWYGRYRSGGVSLLGFKR